MKKATTVKINKMMPTMKFCQRVVPSSDTPKDATAKSQNVLKSTVNAFKLGSHAISIVNVSTARILRVAMKGGAFWNTMPRLLLRTRSKRFNSKARAALYTKRGSQ